MLEKAKKYYPIGTKYKCTVTKNDKEITSEDVITYSGNSVYCYRKGSAYSGIYDSGKGVWAEVTSPAPSTVEFSVGDTVEFYRHPTAEEWAKIGKIDIHLPIGGIGEVSRVNTSSTKGIYVTYNGKTSGWYAKEGFRRAAAPSISVPPSVLPKQVDKGQYFVTLAIGTISTSCAKKDFCFKQRVSGGHSQPAMDTSGSTSNGNDMLKFDLTATLHSWRFATAEEAAHYEVVGRPYDVTTIPSQVTPVGEWSQEAIMEEAKKKYPAGTIFGSARGGGPGYAVNAPAKYYWYASDELVVNSPGGPSIYRAGRWGDIKSTPKIEATLTKSTLIPGEIYNLKDKFIILAEPRGMCRKYVSTISNSYDGNGSYFSEDAGYKEATYEEKEWLRACIKAEKFVPKESISVTTSACKPFDGSSASLIPGNTYTLQDDFIFVATAEDRKHMECITRNSKRLYPPGGFGSREGYKEATPEEIQWLKACVKAGDFVNNPAISTVSYKFKIGDKVTVVNGGMGISSSYKGDKFTIVGLGLYLGNPGYKIDPPEGNCSSGNHGGFIGEASFDLYVEKKRVVEVNTEARWDFVSSKLGSRGHWSSYKENSAIGLTSKEYSDVSFYRGQGYEIVSFADWLRETGYTFSDPEKVSMDLTVDKQKLKNGDWVEMVNLKSNLTGGTYNGKIGHVGQVKNYGGSPGESFNLEPTCIGGSWYPFNFKKVAAPEVREVSPKKFAEPCLVDYSWEITTSSSKKPVDDFKVEPVFLKVKKL